MNREKEPPEKGIEVGDFLGIRPRRRESKAATNSIVIVFSFTFARCKEMPSFYSFFGEEQRILEQTRAPRPTFL